MHTRGSVVVAVAFCSLLTSVCLLPPAAAAEEAREPAKRLAEVTISAGRVDWQPAGEHERLTLTVAGPGDLYIQREFKAGEAPSFSSLDARDGRLLDGVYAYELRAGGREVQWGHLWVQGGSFMDKTPAPPRSVKPTDSASEPRNITADATVIPDDLVVQGQACIGANCGAGDANGPALKVKEHGNYRILFEGLNCCFPWEGRWTLQANEPGSNGDFTIRDVTYQKVPFRIMPLAPDNSLTIYATGNIGLGTLTPAVRLDVKANASGLATERLQNSSATGYSGTEYLDNTGDVGLFFGLDNANFTTRLNSIDLRPLVILTESVERMRVTSAGDIGIGTASPAGALHVSRSSGAVATIARFSNNSGVQMLFDRTDAGANDWQMSNFNSTFQISIPGSSPGQLNLASNGNLAISGTLSQGSSREIKTNFEPLDPINVLERVNELPISVWSYKQDTAARHLGPMAEDFHKAFGLGIDDQTIAPGDTAGVALAAIKGLHQVVAASEAEIAALRRENSGLAEKVAALEKLVSSLVSEEGSEAAAEPAP